MMQAQSTPPVRTFSIGFKEEGFDEAPHAQRGGRPSRHRAHRALCQPARGARGHPRTCPSIYDEPFADSSQIPTYLLSKLTREHVTVALSGDGGDELFAGYTRHRFARMAGKVPARAGRALACGLASRGPACWDRLFRVLPRAPASLAAARQDA